MVNRVQIVIAMSCCLAVLLDKQAAEGANVSLPGPLSYIYDADMGQDANDPEAALDGTWSHENGSDAWDGSAPGSGNPGGLFVERDTSGFARPDVLTIVDTGDPRDNGIEDPSNRKVFLTRTIPELDFNAGSYVYARWRMDPDPPETNLDGSISTSYTLHDQKGQINLGNGANSLSMSYQSESELAIKLGDQDDFALIDIGNSTDFHSVVASMTANDDGTFAVDVWVDGEQQLSVPSAALLGDIHGDGSTPLIGMGVGSTGRAGAIQVDFIGAGVVVPEPGSLGLLVIASCFLASSMRRKRR